MTLVVAFPDTGSQLTVANITDLIGGIVPTTVNPPGFIVAEWPGLALDIGDVASLVIDLFDVEPNLSVKFVTGNAP